MAFTADAAFHLLATAHAQDRLAHAYLITGPAGAGKLALAQGPDLRFHLLHAGRSAEELDAEIWQRVRKKFGD